MDNVLLDQPEVKKEMTRDAMRLNKKLIAARKEAVSRLPLHGAEILSVKRLEELEHMMDYLRINVKQQFQDKLLQNLKLQKQTTSLDLIMGGLDAKIEGGQANNRPPNDIDNMVVI